jgi:hypothetical protein
VPLLGQLAEGALDRRVVGVALDAEDLVVAAFGCHVLDRIREAALGRWGLLGWDETVA